MAAVAGAVGSALVLARTLCKSKRARRELLTRAEFAAETLATRERINATHLALVEKLEVNHRELQGALERQGVRISALEAGLGKVEGRLQQAEAETAAGDKNFSARVKLGPRGRACRLVINLNLGKENSMKILDVMQSGKRGLTVSQRGRYGMISRAYVIPANPRTVAQMNVRSILSRVSARWRGLSEAERAAWTSAARGVQSIARLGQSGPLTGAQLYNKINCNLLRFGQDPVDAPTVRPQFEELAPQGLTVTNTAGTIALKLTCPSDPGDATVIRASAPVSQGRTSCSEFRVLGVCPAPVAGMADITALYTARYGVPPVGTKVFVRVNQMVDGWEDWPVTYVAVVPAAA